MAVNLRSKSVVITGASSGIGAATAKRLAQEGARLLLFARRESRLRNLVQQLGTEVAYFTGDVTKHADLLAASAYALERFGTIDVLVNNAGTMPLSMLSERRVVDWDRMIDVNIKGVLYGIDAVLPSMLAAGTGHIINISSVAGLRIVPTAAVYGATKSAVRAISDGLRTETGGKIRVTSIYPGLVATELLDAIPDSNLREQLNRLGEGHAMAPAVIADAIVYAISQPAGVGVNDIVVGPAGMN